MLSCRIDRIVRDVRRLGQSPGANSSHANPLTPLASSPGSLESLTVEAMLPKAHNLSHVCHRIRAKRTTPILRKTSDLLLTAPPGMYAGLTRLLRSRSLAAVSSTRRSTAGQTVLAHEL